ncbi:DUF5681 domain-containing protein [Falsiroseomonas sp. HC035]|uniref:DUF5681 domain-containing protein n=1 Tax=Falsiroseomonas sp. HC035 TaxID=3390999 RepID=UPI003D317485
MANKPVRKYEVGYGKPPEHSRFKPGQSGNPRGRTKDSVTFSMAIAKALGERVMVNEGGSRHSITKLEAIAKQLVNKAASGDARIIKLLAEMDRRRPTVDHAAIPGVPGEQGPSNDIRDASKIDYSSMTTEQLIVLYEAARIFEGKQERPPPIMPPGDPKPRDPKK